MSMKAASTNANPIGPNSDKKINNMATYESNLSNGGKSVPNF